MAARAEPSSTCPPPRPGSALASAQDEAAITAFAAGQGLAKAHWPEIVRFAESLPRTPAGKVRKNELRERIAVEAGRT